MDFMKEISKVGLSEESYKDCLREIQDKINGDLDMEWEEICDKYNLPISSDTLRKANSKPFGGAFVKAYFEKDSTSSDSVSYLKKLDEIRQERQKLYDERAALRKISRENARNDANLEYMAKLIKEKEFPEINRAFTPVYDSDNDLIITFHDLHYGLDIANSFGVYNSEIAEERTEKYLQRIIEIQKIHHSQNAWVLLGGDLLSGRIHIGVQLQNREDMVEQVQGASELISLFTYKLSKYFDNVYVNGTCGGNHSRLDMNKKDVLRGERLDLLVPWYINARLSHISNIHILEDAVDPTIALMQVRGKNYVGCHGDMDQFSESGIYKLKAMLNIPIEAIIMGHLHHCTYDEISNVKLVRSGSFCDPIDDYSISKRITGHASQMVLVVDEDGVKTLYPVSL